MPTQPYADWNEISTIKASADTRGETEEGNTYDDLEYDIEGREDLGVALEAGTLDDENHEYGERHPPRVVRELRAYLLPDEGGALFSVRRVGLVTSHVGQLGQSALEAAEALAPAFWVDGGKAGVRGARLGLAVFGEDTKRGLFVDVRVTHCYCHRIGRDVHHDDIEELQGDTGLSDSDDIEATGADCEGLEEAIEDTISDG